MKTITRLYRKLNRRRKMFAKILILLLIALPVYANDIYVTQSGASLDLDITQDGQNNTVGNSTTSSWWVD